MSDTEKSFINELKKQAIIILLGYSIAIIATFVGFYFKTEARLEYFEQRHEMQMVRQHNVEQRIDLLNEKKIEKADYIREVDEMKQLLKEMREDIKAMKR